eukprot:6197354-Pleurochrysis_carterae.AAC.1
MAARRGCVGWAALAGAERHLRGEEGYISRQTGFIKAHADKGRQKTKTSPVAQRHSCLTRKPAALSNAGCASRAALS